MRKILATLLILTIISGLVCVPVMAQQTDLERVQELIDSLPDSYKVGNGDVIAEINELIESNGFSRNEIGSAKYIKFITKHLNPHNSWLKKTIYQDRINIKWQDINPVTCVDMFEFANYDEKGVNIAVPIEKIARKPGIVMHYNNTSYFPENLTSGRYIGFYETKSVKEKYPSTFPDSNGEYYITEGGIQFGYSGISENVGDITYNGGMVSTDYSYEIPFDSNTRYSSVSFLVSGTTFLSGEYARQLSPVVTKVYYADGSYEENFHIAGLFPYSYRMALYSYKDGKAYSEIFGQNLSKELDMMWVPKEANVASYFKMGNGLNSRTSYKIDKTIGNATVITIATKNKAIKKVEVAYASVNTIKENGGIAISEYTTKEETPQTRASADTYLMPIDKNAFKDCASYDEKSDYYLAVIRNKVYPIYLHGVTGSKTEGSSYAQQIAKIEEEINALPESFEASVFEKLKSIKERYDFLLNQKVSRGDFDSTAVEKLERLLNYNIKDGKYTVYVAPYGSDSASGTKEAPLRTFEGAAEFVKTLAKDKAVDVIFLEGEYKFEKSVNLTQDNSGTEEFPVTYKAEGDVKFTTSDKVSFKDFTLVKEGENNKISPELIGKIYKLDLNKQGIYPGDMPVFESTIVAGDGYEDMNFFVNDKEQLVSQWPNGESNYATWMDLVNENKNSGVIKADEMRSKRWQGEKFAYFEGYPSPDYSNERNNITIDGDLIKFKNIARFNLDEKHSRRYKVKHILSELDVPGEWYVDRDTNVLYYYPIEDFDENATIEISSKKMHLLTINGLSNVNFDGISFDKIRGRAINARCGLENFNVYNCSFTNISNDAVVYEATSRYDGYLTGTANYIDAANNCEIRGNKFVNIGAAAIVLRGGDRELLTGGNNVIANNYIYNASNKQRCTPVIQMSGFNNNAVNNEAHMLPFHALNYGGNENLIAYNEFYDALRDTGDCGVVYTGRQFLTRGTEIAYNYVHDFKHLDERTHDNGVGIYLDDRQSGIYVHHNIIYPNGIDSKGNGVQNGSGMHNIIEYNTVVDAEEPFTLSNRFVEDFSSSSAGTSVINEVVKISGMQKGEKIHYDDGVVKEPAVSGRYELYFEKYPEIEETVATLLNPNETVKKFVEKYPFILTHTNFVPTYNKDGSIKTEAKYGHLAKDIEEGNDLTKYRLLSLRAQLGNVYMGNVSNTKWTASSNIINLYKNFGSTFENNIQEASNDIFVDYENQDFRIKADLGFEGYIDESFDLNTIGIQADGEVSADVALKDYETKNPRKLSAKEKSFNLTYPENNGKVEDKKNITFMWERPVSSDYFTLEIATDKEMENIVYKNENSYYNFETVTSLPEDVKTFYWRVTARNISRKNGESWQNSDGVNVFHTYEGAYQEAPASVPFDLSTEFNVDLFNNEGEVASKVALGASGDLGMYNLTNLKRLVPFNGNFKYVDTIYNFPQASYGSATDNAIRVQSGNTYKYELKPWETDNYNQVRLAMSAVYAAKDYNIIAHYSDGTSDTAKVALHQYYTIYYSFESPDTILIVDGVNSKGEIISQLNRYNPNKIYQAVVETDENKTLTSLEFIGGSGTVYGNNKNTEFIFAITGIKTQRNTDKGIEKSYFVSNYADEKKDLVLIVTGTENGKPKSKIFTVSVAKNQEFQNFDIEIPKEVYAWENKKMFTWENGTFAPFTAVMPIHK